jgi:tetratricopeptide (TPR) repeat protein
VRFLRRAIELRPTLATAHSWLGSALVSLGHIEEAMAEAKEAVRLDPQDAAAHMTLGRAYWIGKGLIPEGIAEIEKAVALNPEASHAVIQLGLLYALEQDFERAEAAARRAVELQHRSIAGGENGRIVGAHARLGYIFYLQGRLDGALREYERELAFLASSDHALRERTQIEVEEKLGAVHLRLGARAEGLRHLERAVKAYDGRLARGADDPFTKYYVAAAHALLGDGPKALRLLEESARQLPALMARRLKNDRDFDALRGDPGFAALLEKGVPA